MDIKTIYVHFLEKTGHRPKICPLDLHFANQKHAEIRCLFHRKMQDWAACLKPVFSLNAVML
ncbi:hypothetical protein DQQ10_18870 [Pseudochryseolinea flava]|uniref:Uncharacterized protein n=1 Tax=Pseudochryseolinea flava TaxID=2059302 RepID=A0A364XYS7_9BACT|nr:hypothetical protein DQQ10_18870 [Pseudochryseolinea flava]